MVYYTMSSVLPLHLLTTVDKIKMNVFKWPSLATRKFLNKVEHFDKLLGKISEKIDEIYISKDNRWEIEMYDDLKFLPKQFI